MQDVKYIELGVIKSNKVSFVDISNKIVNCFVQIRITVEAELTKLNLIRSTKDLQINNFLLENVINEQSKNYVTPFSSK